MTDAQTRDPAWTGALVAGVIGGLGDGIAATRHLPLAPDPVRDLLLVLISLTTAVVVSLSAAVVFPLLARAFGRRWPAGRWTGFVCGAMAWAVWCVAVLLPGWTAWLPLLGFLALPSFVRRDQGRPRMIVGLSFLALLAVRIANDHRPRDRVDPPAAAHPDIVVVVVDGLRADQLGRRPNGDLAAMPQLDELVASGTRFERAIAPASTAAAARDAVLSGVPPWTEAPRRGWGDELLSAGWQTGLFGGPEVDATARALGFGVIDTDPGWLAGASVGAPGALWFRLVQPEGRRRPARRVVEAWSRWLDRVPGERPAASVLHLSDLSWPTSPPPPWDTAFEQSDAAAQVGAGALDDCSVAAARQGLDSGAEVRASYDGAAASVDALLPDIWALASSRPRGATVFVVGSRGTPLGEDGRWLVASGDTHPADVRVVLAAFGAGVPEQSTLGAPSSTVDVVATIRALADLAPVADARPLPGIVLGYPPREAVHAVGGDGSVLTLTGEQVAQRTERGALRLYQNGAWLDDVDDSTVPPVPVLPSVVADPDPCRTRE